MYGIRYYLEIGKQELPMDVFYSLEFGEYGNIADYKMIIQIENENIDITDILDSDTVEKIINDVELLRREK